MPRRPQTICPKCGGTGRGEFVTPEDPYRTHFRRYPCEMCQGTGKINSGQGLNKLLSCIETILPDTYDIIEHDVIDNVLYVKDKQLKKTFIVKTELLE